MFEKTPLILAIDKGDLIAANDLYANGDRIPHSDHSYDYSQLYDTIIRKKGYELLNKMAEAGEIERDLYMYDKLDDSIFSKLLRVKNVDEDYLNFFNDFINQAENLNEEVSGQTLLSHAIDSAAEPTLLKALIQSGCQADFKNQAEDSLISISIAKYGLSPETLKDYVQTFIDEGVDINQANKAGKTALHIALDLNKRHILDTLLQNGADPNHQDSQGHSAFYIAIAHKLDLETYRKLAEFDSMDFEQTDKQGEKALHQYLRIFSANSAEKPELLLQMIEDGANLDSTSPHYAKEVSAWDWIAEKKSNVFEQVFNAVQPDVNAQDDLGNTLLHKVVAKDSNYDQNYAKETYKKVKFLLDAGASASILNNNEQTAMMLASEDNLKAKTVEILLIAQQKEN